MARSQKQKHGKACACSAFRQRSCGERDISDVAVMAMQAIIMRVASHGTPPKVFKARELVTIRSGVPFVQGAVTNAEEFANRFTFDPVFMEEFTQNVVNIYRALINRAKLVRVPNLTNDEAHNWAISYLTNPFNTRRVNNKIAEVVNQIFERMPGTSFSQDDIKELFDNARILSNPETTERQRTIAVFDMLSITQDFGLISEVNRVASEDLADAIRRLENEFMDLINPTISAFYRIDARRRLTILNGGSVSCAICHEMLYNGRELSTRTCENGHVYHKACIDMWLSGRDEYGRVRTCPQCRLPMNRIRNRADV